MSYRGLFSHVETPRFDIKLHPRKLTAGSSENIFSKARIYFLQTTDFWVPMHLSFRECTDGALSEVVYFFGGGVGEEETWLPSLKLPNRTCKNSWKTIVSFPFLFMAHLRLALFP